MIDNNKLKQVLDYNRESGVFTWLVCSRNQMRKGSVAGHVSRDGYVKIQIGGKEYLAHRLAWQYVYGETPPAYVDHINRDVTDNRIENLRACSNSENQMNRKAGTNSKTGLKGVSQCKGRYFARAKIKGVTHYKYGFETAEDAFDAACKLRKELHKDFARNA